MSIEYNPLLHGLPLKLKVFLPIFLFKIFIYSIYSFIYFSAFSETAARKKRFSLPANT